MIHYVCKYTPVEIFAGFGQQCVPLETMSRDYSEADLLGHINLCGFGKSIIKAVEREKVEELVLVNCCDVMRRVYDVVRASRKVKFVYLLDLPHTDSGCAVNRFVHTLERLKKAYESYSGIRFDEKLFLSSFKPEPQRPDHYVGIIGSRVSRELQSYIESKISFPVVNLTCLGNREVPSPAGSDDIRQAYASGLLSQLPCSRMEHYSQRRALYNDPRLDGVIYHAMKFCDFAQIEFVEYQKLITVPVVRIETDFTLQSEGQLSTRLEAFAESLEGDWMQMDEKEKKPYVAGIDSGSATTSVVIMDDKKQIVSYSLIPTGGGAKKSAALAFEKALEDGKIAREDVGRVVATGYGRTYLDKTAAVTEISCHAKGAVYLNPGVRTIIDIGGQDSKVIRVDESGDVVKFAMNDKCAAGTGKFLEMMARSLDLPMDTMASMGLKCKEKLTISSMCTVFAESEVVSLVAQSKRVEDIVYALNTSVANKTGSMVSRIGLNPLCMITGGVSRNKGVVQALERKLDTTLVVDEKAQLCGAIGAALFALGD